MAGKAAQLIIEIITDAAKGMAGLDKTKAQVDDIGDAAKASSSKMSGFSDGFDDLGGKSGQVTTGLRDMSDAVAMLGFPEAAAGMQVAAVGFESLDGAATLYAGAQGLASKAAGGFTKAMNIMKVSILTNPIFIIAAIIIAIGAALVIAYLKCETFRKIVDAAFRAVWNVIKAVWNWIKNNWKTLLVILTGPIGLAVAFIATHWDKIKAGAKTLIDWVKGAWKVVKGYITAPFEAAWDVLSGIFDKISDAVDNVIGWISRIKFPSMPSWLPGVSSAGFAAPAVAGRAAAPRASSGGVTVNVNGAWDPEAVARQIRRVLAASDARGGRTGTLRPVGTV